MMDEESSTLEIEFGDVCFGDYHKLSCPTALFGSPCRMELAARAREQIAAFAYSDMFRLCFNDPWRADGYKLFEGIVQDHSLIYDNKSVQISICHSYAYSSRDIEGIILDRKCGGSRLSEKVRGIKENGLGF